MNLSMFMQDYKLQFDWPVANLAVMLDVDTAMESPMVTTFSEPVLLVFICSYWKAKSKL